MFYIGNHLITSPYLLAPMAGVSEMPYRVIALEHGAGLATTELISAKGLFHQNLRTLQYLTYNKEKEIPYSLQLFGGEEQAMAKAAALAVEAGAHIVDINMGCPVKKVTQTGAGSALMCDPKRAANLVKAMRMATDDKTPITVKIRTGWDADSINCIEMGKALQDAGCAAIAMHARTRAQGYSGNADWLWIRQLKEALQIPVIGNGDVRSPDDAKRMQKETNCDGVMIGRAALGNPWIFLALNGKIPHHIIPAKERIPLILRHFEEHIAFHTMLDPKGELRAIRSFRAHLVWYSHGIHSASQFREQVMQLEDKEQILEAILHFFSKAGSSNDTSTDNEADSIDYRQAFG